MKFQAFKFYFNSQEFRNFKAILPAGYTPENIEGLEVFKIGYPAESKQGALNASRACFYEYEPSPQSRLQTIIQAQAERRKLLENYKHARELHRLKFLSVKYA